jgi:hypothetical protein
MEYRSTVRTKAGIPSPPDWMAAIVEELLPGPNAERTAKNLRENYPDAVSYIQQSAGKILSGIAEGIVSAFDFKKVFGEAFALFVVAFWGAPLQPKIAVTVMALIALRPRDAYVYYRVGSAGDAATDGLVMTAVVALSQVYLLKAYPPAVMPGLPMVLGSALGMLLVAFWRLFCQLHTPFDNPQKRPEFRVFSSALRINVMFFVACVASLMAGVEAVPDTGHLRNSLLAALFPVTICIMIKSRMNVMGSPLWGKVDAISIFAPLDQEESELKQEALPTPLPVKPSRGMIVAMRFQVLAIMIIGAPVGIAIWRWVTGSPEPVRWPQVAMNFVSWIALAFLWMEIKKLNFKAVMAMKAARLLDKQDDSAF